MHVQDSLSGDSKTLMLVNVNPKEADAGETACSLGFAARVRGVELGPAKKHIEAGAEVQELRAQLEALRQQVGPNAGPVFIQPMLVLFSPPVPNHKKRKCGLV